jgi:hypothetical protein
LSFVIGSVARRIRVINIIGNVRVKQLSEAAARFARFTPSRRILIASVTNPEGCRVRRSLRLEGTYDPTMPASGAKQSHSRETPERHWPLQWAEHG